MQPAFNLTMKILYVVDSQADYLSDQIYYGLCKTIGHQNVIDFPPKALYHDSLQKVWYLPQLPRHSYSEEDIVAMLTDKVFDFVCLAAPRLGSLQALASLAEKAKLPPLVMIDGEDDSRIRYEIAETYGVKLYFKREYIWVNNKKVRRLRDYYNYVRSFHYNKNLFQMTYPLSFSIILESIPKIENIEKNIDVSFRGFVWSKESRKRLLVLQKLQRMESIHLTGGIYTPSDTTGRVSPDEYYREVMRSRIAVSIRGGGFDTCRFWEIPACRTLLLSEKPDIDIPEGFEHERHAVFCQNNLSDLTALVRYYLEHDEQRERITEQGYQHLLRHHTCERRAEYFLDLCKKEL